ITASSMLSKDDVAKMVREAQEHAEEDRQRREQVETRNQADALAFQAERTLRDLGDKVGSEDKAETERRIEAVREALKGDDQDAIRSAASALAEQLQKVGTAAYQASGPEPGGADGDGTSGGPTDGATEEPAPEGAEDEAVEGEFKEV
ncbi:MAG: molecular chaperone DnaK, partial [Chloroflexota bacterium]